MTNPDVALGLDPAGSRLEPVGAIPRDGAPEFSKEILLFIFNELRSYAQERHADVSNGYTIAI